MSSHKATLTKVTDQHHLQKSSKEDELMKNGQENNFCYGVVLIHTQRHDLNAVAISLLIKSW